MPMVCDNSSADVDFCDSLLGYMQDHGINQNSLLIRDHVVRFFFQLVLPSVPMLVLCPSDCQMCPFLPPAFQEVYIF